MDRLIKEKIKDALKTDAEVMVVAVLILIPLELLTLPLTPLVVVGVILSLGAYFLYSALLLMKLRADVWNLE